MKIPIDKRAKRSQVLTPPAFTLVENGFIMSRDIFFVKTSIARLPDHCWTSFDQPIYNWQRCNDLLHPGIASTLLQCPASPVETSQSQYFLRCPVTCSAFSFREWVSHFL